MSTKPGFFSGLPHFIGSETWNRHPLNRSITFSDGAKYVADARGAYWLLDEIVTNQLAAGVRREEFQHWKLEVNSNKAGCLATIETEGVFTTRIPFTDFTIDEIRFYVTGNVMMLPSEH
ncbi:DUF6876 family protein [Rhodomicrobium sp. Az07]|uniref:DUF6876 family protein n=1 Tax=Rhodomicrobium sp. Az07 TaxID=2839034 RepID=UPI00352FFC18